MRWNSRPPYVLLQTAFVDRVRLRRTALRYATHGWPVTPGACLAGSRFVCGRPGCTIMGCHPALEDWEHSASAEVSTVAAWWRRRPHSVLLATGVAFDVLEAPQPLALRTLAAARLRANVTGRPDHSRLDGAECGRRGAHPAGRRRRPDAVPAPAAGLTPAGQGRGPVAVNTAGSWLFLVRPGTSLRPELARNVVRHGHGSWIPAPPTRTPVGRMRWVVSPEQTQWRLPASAVVQQMLVDALGTLGHRRPGPAVVPRQTSTARRAA
jgi:hypothetical protein